MIRNKFVNLVTSSHIHFHPLNLPSFTKTNVDDKSRKCSLWSSSYSSHSKNFEFNGNIRILEDVHLLWQNFFLFTNHGGSSSGNTRMLLGEILSLWSLLKTKILSTTSFVLGIIRLGMIFINWPHFMFTCQTLHLMDVFAI